MLLAIVAHEKLLDFETARVPPCDADEKRVGARAPGEACRFSIEEKPLTRVRDFRGCAGRHQAQRIGVQFAIGDAEIGRAGHRLRKPFAQREVLAEAIAGGRSAENFGQPCGALGNIRGVATRRGIGAGGGVSARWMRLQRFEPADEARNCHRRGPRNAEKSEGARLKKCVTSLGTRPFVFMELRKKLLCTVCRVICRNLRIASNERCFSFRFL